GQRPSTHPLGVLVHARHWFDRPRAPRDPPSFPTRRSSDLYIVHELADAARVVHDVLLLLALAPVLGADAQAGVQKRLLPHAGVRSEEHTSELQSRFDLVCRLLRAKTKDTGAPRAHRRATGA